MYGRYLLVVYLIGSFCLTLFSQSLAINKNQDLESNEGTTLSDTPPRGNDPWIHSVIFEPLPKIKLTRSSYQVTTFLDFQPFLRGFNRVKEYMDQFIKDMNDPNYIYGVPMRISIIELAKTNDTELGKLLDSSGCKVHPHQCMTMLKIAKFHEEVQYLAGIFNKIHHKFLAAIDHLDFHSSAGDNTNRSRRSATFQEEGKYNSYNRTMTEDEIQFTEELLYELKRINPVAHDKLKHFKRVDLLTWFLGWGVFSNSHNIKKIKENLFILQQQNKIQTFQI